MYNPGACKKYRSCKIKTPRAIYFLLWQLHKKVYFHMEISFSQSVLIMRNGTKLNPKLYRLSQQKKFSELFFVENIALEVMSIRT